MPPFYFVMAEFWRQNILMSKGPISLRLFFVIAFFIFCTIFFHGKTIQLQSDKAFLAPPPEHIEYLSFGFKESMADSLWLRWIQDADTCYTYWAPSGDIPAGSGAANHDRLTSNPRHKICDDSWAFKMLDAITRLDPRFKMPYTLGASALSVLVEDYKGASVLFDRGTRVYPNDWLISYRAAYHFLFDQKDLEKSAKLLVSAADKGGPFWLRSLAARLYTRTGQLELGIVALENYRKSFTKNEQLKAIDERIAKMKFELRRSGGASK
jgi:hypothetical protein